MQFYTLVANANHTIIALNHDWISKIKEELDTKIIGADFL